MQSPSGVTSRAACRMGLAISRSVESHGGRLCKVTSNPGPGQFPFDVADPIRDGPGHRQRGCADCRARSRSRGEPDGAVRLDWHWFERL